jgi:hypothetical protein
MSMIVESCWALGAPLRCARACGARKNGILSFTQHLPLSAPDAPRGRAGLTYGRAYGASSSLP